METTSDLAPDADEPGDDFPVELNDLVTTDTETIVSDNIDEPPTEDETIS